MFPHPRSIQSLFNIIDPLWQFYNSHSSLDAVGIGGFTPDGLCIADNDWVAPHPDDNTNDRWMEWKEGYMVVILGDEWYEERRMMVLTSKDGDWSVIYHHLHLATNR
jgi:hypothetical protein